MEQKAIRGAFFDFIDDPWKHLGHEKKVTRFYPDGVLVVEKGVIKAHGPYSEVAGMSRFRLSTESEKSHADRGNMCLFWSIKRKMGAREKFWLAKKKCRRLFMSWERLPEVWGAFAMLGLVFMYLQKIY